MWLLFAFQVGWTVGSELNHEYHLSETAADNGINARNLALERRHSRIGCRIAGGLMTIGVSIGAVNPALFDPF